ncbi:MAG: cytochrome c oxidase cbb3-type subunit [Chloroflexota bacterium]|nr:cytochrome c oxidase cbb3-type subunit [Chloroflexota bacterium]
MKMTFKTILIGGLVVFFAVVAVAVFAPTLTWKPEQTVVAHEYTSEQEKGRELFYSNGCNYCHTQYVREEDTAMGPVSDAGNYVFDNPVILGSERTGPDLSYIGRKRSEEWEIEHLKSPRDLSPLSIMPNFNFLADDELSAIATYLFNLGDRVAQERMIRPPDVYTGMENPKKYALVADGGSSDPQGWPTFTETGLQNGKEVYVKYCLTCHGCAGNGLGSYGGTLAVTPADFKQEPIRNMPDDEWFWHVSEGLPGTVMPTWKESLSESDRWDVIRYVQRIYSKPAMHDPDEGDPPAPYSDLTNPLDVSTQVLDEGKAIFIRECMVCHGDAGRGNGPYRATIQPGPPDFGDGSYGDYSDADYFWRISEGVPWTAMPAWKLQYGEEDRWKLVHYIRGIFTQTEDIPAIQDPGDEVAQIYYDQTMPDSASYERGKTIFMQQCAHCHGLAGDSQGWDGAYLNPAPANFHDMLGKQMTPSAMGEHLVKVTFGIHNSAMPTWGEWLPESDRWDAIKYLMQSFMMGKPAADSVYQEGEISSEFLLLSSDVYLSEGHTINTDNGQPLYAQYCATCHGDTGQGDGPGTVDNASKGPAPFPANMSEAYIYWRIWEGVPDSMMYNFKWLLDDQQTWEITTYMTNTLLGGAQ